MTTERLFEFLVLSKYLNYSRAAKELYMTQSALSRHIKEMEAELGTVLLERSTHGVSLTEAGGILARGSQSILDKYESALDRLAVTGLDVTGSLRIACAESSVYEIFLSFTRQFTAKYGGIDFRIDVISGDTDHRELIEDYDVLLSAFALRDLPRSVSRSLAFRDPAVLMTPYGHPLNFRHSAELEVLSGKTLYMPYSDRADCSYGKLAALVKRMNRDKVSIVDVPTRESAVLMVSLGRGFALLPKHLSGIIPENTATLNVATKGCAFDTYLYRNTARENPAARLFSEEFAAFCARSRSPSEG